MLLCHVLYCVSILYNQKECCNNQSNNYNLNIGLPLNTNGVQWESVSIKIDKITISNQKIIHFNNQQSAGTVWN